MKRYLRIILVLVLAAIPTARAGESAGRGYDGPKDKLHIYILLGGQTMCGTGTYTTEEGGVIPGCYLLNRDDRWEPAEAPLNRYSSVIERLDTQKLGPGNAFAREMRRCDPSVSVGLIVNADDGMTLKTVSAINQPPMKDWLKGTNNYDEVIRRYNAVKDTGVVKGIVWHHGETDRKNEQYLEQLKSLVADLRKDLGAPELPFVAGQIDPKSRTAPTVNPRIAALPGQVSGAAVVNMEGLEKRGQYLGTRGAIGLGQRYAEAMLKLQGRDTATAAPETPAETPAEPPVPAPSAYDGRKENLHVYLLIGQSNMAGRAPYPVEDGGVIERCFLLNRAGLWEPAKVPFNRYCTISDRLDSSALNPGYMFAKTMLDKNPSINVGIISNARGSTSITAWGKGSKYYKAAMKRIEQARKTGTLKGILWHQGESDEKDGAYLEKLVAMVQAYRTDLGDSDLPFVAGEINNVPLINDQINELPKKLPRTGVASAEGLKAKDRWHFNYESMKTLGARYAEAMMSMQKKCSLR